MAKTHKAADGTSYSLRLAGRRGEALTAFWQEKATAGETLNTLRGLVPSAAPSEPHKVEPFPEGFRVTSGRSGRAYLVVPLATGGASCNCEAGRRAIVASRCSHVRAVEAFAAEVMGEKR